MNDQRSPMDERSLGISLQFRLMALSTCPWTCPTASGKKDQTYMHFQLQLKT